MLLGIEQIDSSREGTEVLEALGKSSVRLLLSLLSPLSR